MTIGILNNDWKKKASNYEKLSLKIRFITFIYDISM